MFSRVAYFDATVYNGEEKISKSANLLQPFKRRKIFPMYFFFDAVKCSDLFRLRNLIML